MQIGNICAFSISLLLPPTKKVIPGYQLIYTYWYEFMKFKVGEGRECNSFPYKTVHCVTLAHSQNSWPQRWCYNAQSRHFAASLNLLSLSLVALYFFFKIFGSGRSVWQISWLVRAATDETIFLDGDCTLWCKIGHRCFSVVFWTLIVNIWVNLLSTSFFDNLCYLESIRLFHKITWKQVDSRQTRALPLTFKYHYLSEIHFLPIT